MKTPKQVAKSGDSARVEDRPEIMSLSERDAGVPLGEATYRALCRALRDGSYRPGDRLREEEVARRLSVSRTPVREAFGRLLARRLVVPVGARGLIVRNLSTSDILELYALREILEGAAARLAAKHASEPEMQSMNDLEASFERHDGNPREMARLNHLLHETIFRAARNQYLDLALQEMQDAIALLGPTTFGVGGRPSSAAVEHQAILSAIHARDADAAEHAARAHIRGALRSRLELIHEA